jgi:hypothetical protein
MSTLYELLPHGMYPQKDIFLIVIITWLINKRKFIEVNVMNHKVLQLLVNRVATWHGMSTSLDHKSLLFTSSCKNQYNFVIT